jgi:ribosome maturation factor RimP
MIEKSRLENIILNKLADGEAFLVELQVTPGNVIHVFIDKPEGISIDECVEMSRHINSMLDREEEDYELEVSSPGLEMPFRAKQQYEKYLNRPVQIVMNDGTKYTGNLISYDDSGIEIEYEKSIKEPGKKKKSLVTDRKQLMFNDIKTTKAVVSFK